MMQNNIPEKHIHDGHRSRMRSKLLSHGQRIFDTYELLEMLLYYTVPYKDTNPISKRLLYAFGDLEGVFNAKLEELTEISGVGEKTARLIKDVGELSEVIETEVVPYTESIFSNHRDAGGFFTEYFRAETEKKVVAAYLDNNLDLISLEDVACGVDYESGAIKPKLFMDGAIKHRASAVITAHNHPFGTCYPSFGDRETHTMVIDALSGIQVTVLEHYVVSGNCYQGIPKNTVKNFCRSPYLDSFIRTKGETECALKVSEETLNRLENCYNHDDIEYFEQLLSYASRNSEGIGLRLLKRFHTIEGTFCATFDELGRYAGEGVAVYIKLLSYITSRRYTDRFLPDKSYTEQEYAEFLKSLYLGVSDETVYALCLDTKNKFIACDLVSIGTVNFTDVLPRKILEIALKYSSDKIYISHNHPFGKPQASGEDLMFTSTLASVLRNSGIELLGHFIVAGRKCVKHNYTEISMTML